MKKDRKISEKIFRRYIWIELIGFDNTSPDYGVSAYLETLGFVPEGISLLMTSVDFVNMHRGMAEEYVLPEYICSYAGHTHNDERERQAWTNYQLRGLFRTLRRHGVKSYISLFDWVREDERSLTASHPEIQVYTADGRRSNHICMIKRFADGTYYEDFLVEKLLEAAEDYGFDGVHIADGVSSPRLSLQSADFSEDVLEQSGIRIPEGADRVQYILCEKRLEWIRFYRKRWYDFLRKVTGALEKNGRKIILNSAWTKDSVEAIYRYGVDYKDIDALGIEAFIPEDVANSMAILSTQDSAGVARDCQERKALHYEYTAALLCIGAQMKHTPVVPLFPIRDTMEQWSVLHHMPTAMQRTAGNNLNKYRVTARGLEPVIAGTLYCLGDALSEAEWGYIEGCFANGYTEKAEAAEGATMLWSECRKEREVESLIRHRTWHSAKWLAELLARGAMIQKTATVEELEAVTGPLLVTNPHLLSEEEFEKVKGYKNGKVIYARMPEEKTYSEGLNPEREGFPVPLVFAPVPEEILQNYVEAINENLPYISEGKESCHVSEIRTGKKTARFLVDNEDYFYVLPKVYTGREIKCARAITKAKGYQVRVEGDTFRLRVPGRGMDVVEVEFV